MAPGAVSTQRSCAFLYSARLQPCTRPSTHVSKGTVVRGAPPRVNAGSVRQGYKRRIGLVAQAESEQATEAKTDKDELPIWARREAERKLEQQDGLDLPFGVYLLASAIVAIAAVGSIFEFVNKNAIFGALPPSSPFWAPILLTFAITGLPSAGYLFLKAIKSANQEAERQDKADGF